MSETSIHGPNTASKGTEKNLTVAVYGGVLAALVGGVLYYTRSRAKVEDTND